MSRFKTEIMRPLPQATDKGLWLNAALFVDWEDINHAEFIWRLGLPYIKLYIRTKSRFVYKKPEVPLFYRRLGDLLTETEKCCPTDHVFRKALPLILPERPYRLFYYAYTALGMLASMAIILGLLWAWDRRV